VRREEGKNYFLIYVYPERGAERRREAEEKTY
jgi:hypothetical protein